MRPTRDARPDVPQVRVVSARVGAVVMARQAIEA
jgi:hypothetical protein